MQHPRCTSTTHTHPDRVTPAAVRIDTGIFANRFAAQGMSQSQRWAALVEYAVWAAGRSDLLTAIRTELRGRDLVCACPVDDPSCHRSVLADLAHPGREPHSHPAALTVRRPWASMLLIPSSVGGKNVENRTWATDYRGPVLIRGAAGPQTGVDAAGIAMCGRMGFDVPWHSAQKGWLGAAVLTDVHEDAGCCKPWGQTRRHRDQPLYHWVFQSPARLAARTWGAGFEGLHPHPWSVLVNRSALHGQPRAGCVQPPRPLRRLP